MPLTYVLGQHASLSTDFASGADVNARAPVLQHAALGEGSHGGIHNDHALLGIVLEVAPAQAAIGYHSRVGLIPEKQQGALCQC